MLIPVGRLKVAEHAPAADELLGHAREPGGLGAGDQRVEVQSSPPPQT